MHSTIRLTKATKERLSKFGDLSSSYDSVVNAILDHVEKCEHCMGKIKDAS